MGTDNVTIGELMAQMAADARRLGYSEVSIWRDWMPRAWILLGAATGLRACDIIRLKLTDIDWRKGEIRVEQKNWIIWMTQK